MSRRGLNIGPSDDFEDMSLSDMTLEELDEFYTPTDLPDVRDVTPPEADICNYD